MAQLYSAPGLMIRADASIAECVRRMREHGVGAILVVQDDDRFPAKLVGVFTERDLIKRIDQIQHGGYWDRPVRTLMSHPVVTLDVAEIHRAGELMLEHGFRHVPVVHRLPGGASEVLGMVSMRDLFRLQLAEKKSLKWKGQTLTLGVITENIENLDTYSNQIFGLLKVSLRRVEAKDFPTAAKDIDALFIDLDRQDPAAWPDLLKKLNQSKNLPRTIILFDPLNHPPGVVARLQKMRNTEKFSIFAKPVNLTALLTDLGRVPRLR